MLTANEAGAILAELKQQAVSRPDIIRRLSDACLGWPYVYGAAGEMCTPANRRKFAGYHPEYQEKIYGACPALSGVKTTIIPANEDHGDIVLPKVSNDKCAGCKWQGCRIFDCRGFTRWLLAQVSLTLAGGGATSQWDTASNWAAKGEIKDIPRGLVCCVFKRKDGKMSHTGMYLGYWVKDILFDTTTGQQFPDKGPEIIHCSTVVKTDTLPGKPAWTHWGIPAGLYTTNELREAGIDVDESKNIPTLHRGSEGEAVEELQFLLNSKYGADLDIDGKFGAKTEAAVKAFQKAHGLTADGVVGPKTRRALGLAFDGDTQNAQNRNHEAPDNPENGGFDTDINVPDNSAENISTAHIIWDRLMRAIGNPYGVAGLMGNLQAESGLNPENLQNTGNRALGMTDAEYTAAVDTGKYTAEQFIHDGYGYGLAQWTYYSRKANLLNFAVGKGCSIGDLDTQIEFLLAEMRLHYSGVLDTLDTAATVRDASDAVMLKYEKPANTSEENQARRAELGQKFFNQFADVGKTFDPGPMDGPVGDPAEWDDEEAADGVWIPRLKLLEMQAALSDCLGIIKNALEGE